MVITWNWNCNHLLSWVYPRAFSFLSYNFTQLGFRKRWGIWFKKGARKRKYSDSAASFLDLRAWPGFLSFLFPFTRLLREEEKAFTQRPSEMGRGKFKGKPTGRRHFSTPEEMRTFVSFRDLLFNLDLGYLCVVGEEQFVKLMHAYWLFPCGLLLNYRNSIYLLPFVVFFSFFFGS